MIKKLQALSRWADSFFTVWLQYGFGNCVRFFWSLFNHRPIVIKTETGDMVYNAESVGPTVYHITHSLPKLKQLVAAIPKEDHKLMIDVGANCGHFSRLFADEFPTAKIYVVEPSPILYPIIERNLQGKNYELVPLAFADQDGDTTLYLSQGSQQANSLIKGNVESFQYGMRTLVVKTQRLQTFVDQHQIDSIDVLKLDCQGAEYLILQNAGEVLAKVKYLILEISLLDGNIEELLCLVRQHFPNRKNINSIMMGADVLFWR